MNTNNQNKTLSQDNLTQKSKMCLTIKSEHKPDSQFIIQPYVLSQTNFSLTNIIEHIPT